MGLSVRCVRKSTAVQLLAKNFAAMRRLGDPVLKPFLQACMPAPKTTPCSSLEYLLQLGNALEIGFMSLRKPCMILLRGCGNEQGRKQGLGAHTAALALQCSPATVHTLERLHCHCARCPACRNALVIRLSPCMRSHGAAASRGLPNRLPGVQAVAHAGEGLRRITAH